MKLEILTENFKKALLVCEKVTRKSLSLPVLQNVLLTTKQSSVELLTTNLETTIRVWVLAKVEKQGSVLVPANFTANLFGLLKEEKVFLEEKDGGLVLTAKSQKNKIQTQNPQDFPVIPETEGNLSFEVSASTLSLGLNQTVDVPSTSQIRPEISGVFFSAFQDKLKIAATDSFRLAEKTITLLKAPTTNVEFILPQTSSKEIAGILQAEDEKVAVLLGKNQVLFQVFAKDSKKPRVEVMSRLVEGQYPNYKEIIPSKSTTKIRLKKDEFDNFVKKAGLFSGKLMEIKLNAQAKENKLTILAKSAELGSDESTMSCVVDGVDVEVAFNHRFLSEGLNKMKSSEVLLELNGPDSPGVLRPVGDLSYLYILMPIKAQ